MFRVEQEIDGRTHCLPREAGVVRELRLVELTSGREVEDGRGTLGTEEVEEAARVLQSH